MSRYQAGGSHSYDRKDRYSDPNREEKEKIIKEAQKEWGKGSIQRQELEEVKAELLEMANQPFARTKDDKQLEDMLKSKIRSDDPLAEYFLQKQEKKRKYDSSDGGHRESKSKANAKPTYKGPNSTPNRFGIHPGYRWDGVDRSNNYEQRVLTAINEKTAFNEDHYRWATSDM